MGRIGLALVLLIGWMSVAHANRAVCPTAQLKLAKHIERDPSSTDKTPPAMPQITELKLYADPEAQSETISMGGTFDPDTATIQLTTSGGYSLVTTPDRLWVCSKGLVLREHEHITIVAYDKAGNASEPFESDPTVTFADVEKEHHHRCGMGEGLLFVGSIVLSGGLFILLIVFGFIQKNAPFSVAGEFLSPILAENVARIVARRYATKFSVALFVSLGLWTFGHPYFAILVAPFAVVWLFEVLMSRYVVGQFDNKIERLEKRENWIYINSSKLYAPRRTWAKASALPAAAVLD